MNEHMKAQHFIHARTDDALNQDDSGWLDRHLQRCDTCRRYASEIQKVDAGLRHHYLFRNETYLKDQSSSLSLRAIDSILNQSRAKMNTKRTLTTANSLSFVLLLVFQAGALTWLLNMHFLKPIQLSLPSQETQIPALLVPIATVEPTISPEISDASQIVDRLEILAQKNMTLFIKPGWLHEQMRDAGEPGMLRTSYNETWTHFPHGDGVSAEFLSLTKDNPDGATYYQFIVRLADGASGDLIQLRQGPGQQEHTSPVNLPLKMIVDQTQAGMLATRITQASQGAASNDPTSKITELRLWYAPFDGKPAVLVRTTFEIPESTPPIQIETRTFELTSGLMLKEQIRQEWADGALFAEFSTLYQTEFVDALPAETVVTFELAASELKFYQTKASTAVAPTSISPPPTPDTSLLDSLTYTQANPLKDGNAILKILGALYQRHLSWVSRPGWKLFGPREVKAQGLDLNRFILTHMLDSGMGCEWMTYYRKGEQILPDEIRITDSSWGLIGVVEDGKFTEGELEAEPCRLENTETVQMFSRERDSFRDLLSANTLSDYAAWFEEIDGQVVFVLFQDIRYQTPKPVPMDPDTQKLETEDRELGWQYYDLETGGFVEEKYQVYLENGKVFGETPAKGQKPRLSYQYFENLPPVLVQAFEKAVLDLKNYLANPNQ